MQIQPVDDHQPRHINVEEPRGLQLEVDLS